MGDPGDGYRSDEERQEWQKKDPILRFRAVMIESGIAESELEAIDQEVKADVKNAVESAKSAPWPDVEEVDLHVFA